MICCQRLTEIDAIDNSPKRQIFLELALKQYCPNTRHEILKGLCKTHWVERDSCFETFGKLYEHVVTCLDAMENSYVYSGVKESRSDWNSDTKTTAHGLKVVCRIFELLLASQY